MSPDIRSEDALLDHNLRTLGSRLALPQDPTASQRRRWKSGARPDAHARRSRRWLLSATAVAATMLAALYVTPSRHSVVQARTILHQLRESTHRGLRVAFTNVGDQDACVSGRVSVVFQQEFTLAKLLSEEPPPDLTLEGLYLDARVRLGENAEELAGLDLHAAAALTDADKWVYVQCDDPTPLLEATGPVGALLVTPLRRGVLLDLAGVLTNEELWDSSEDSDAEATASEDTTKRLGGSIHVGADADELGALVEKFVSGKAAPEELDELVSKVEEAAAEVRVAEVEPGLYLLTAHDFTKLSDDADAEDAAWLPDLTLRVAYRPQMGVEWAEITNVGALRGLVRLEFIDAPEAADRIERSAYVQDGVTVILDLAEIGKSLEALTKSAGAAPEDE